MSSRLNPNLHRLNKSSQLHSAEHYVEKILAGDRVALGQAITLIESTASAHQLLAQQIVEQCLPHSGKSKRISITGSPGVGKSTFIEAIGQHLIREQEKKVAVLAIDPSSQIHKGSILGDKTRMEKLSRLEEAFIRPSPAGETLGGVARKTRESIILCEAANYEVILIETVGVGQSEIAVHSMVDCFLLLLLPGAGDELQGIKRGIVEMADFVLINKAEKERMALAKNTKKSYRNALHLFPQKDNGWTSTIHAISALNQVGLKELWKDIEDYFQHIEQNQYLEKHRNEQATYWLHESIESGLKNWFYNDRLIREKMQLLEHQVANKNISPFKAAADLLREKLGEI